MQENSNSEGNNGASGATLDPKVKTRRKLAPKKSPPRQLPPWKVLLHNDDVNTSDYVAQTIEMLTPLNKDEALSRTIEAHKTGVSLLLVTHKERAELYQEQFQSKKLTVTIEPADKG